MMKVLYLVILVVGVFLTGCTLHYVPSIHPVDQAAVPDFKGEQAVCVVNISTTSGETILGTSSGGYTYMGDLSKWTDTAVALLKSELQNRGFIIRDCSESTKEIKMSIIKAQIVVSMGSKCFLELHLETGKGYTRNYLASNSSFTYDRASDGAVTRAVIAILNDKNITEYLQATDEQKETQ
jgi:hypothetical protein